MELDPQPTNDPQQFEVTEATATDLLGAPGKTIVPVKMLIGKWNFSCELRGLAG